MVRQKFGRGQLAGEYRAISAKSFNPCNSRLMYTCRLRVG